VLFVLSSSHVPQPPNHHPLPMTPAAAAGRFRITRIMFIVGLVISGVTAFPLLAELKLLVSCVVLAISATYELFEWASALSLGQGAEEFLGTQGDPWDTQSDMAFAVVGGVVALMTLSHFHNRQLFVIQTKR
jgi:uncharacterized membrane protein YjdF